MSDPLPIVYLARHGETAWSISGQHTGLTDLPLTQRGERNALRLGERLTGIPFAKVWCSPLARAKQTCALAGLAERAELHPDLVEWDYGDYEGLRSIEIHRDRPGWNLFRDGCPGGESPAQVIARADRVVGRARSVDGNAVLFSSGHILRVVASRWVNADPASAARFLMLSTASLSALGYEGDRSRPAIRLWNETQHVEL